MDFKELNEKLLPYLNEEKEDLIFTGTYKLLELGEDGLEHYSISVDGLGEYDAYRDVSDERDPETIENMLEVCADEDMCNDIEEEITGVEVHAKPMENDEGEIEVIFFLSSDMDEAALKYFEA